ncbi:MAG: plasmid mobilization relaxosome protein MobC [Bacilli bacterium]
MKENRVRANRATLRLTDKENEIFQDKLKKTGLSQQAFLYKMVFDNYIVIMDFKEMAALRNEINKIGININQIARKVNETQIIEIKEIEYMKKQIEECNEKMDKLMLEILQE